MIKKYTKLNFKNLTLTAFIFFLSNQAIAQNQLALQSSNYAGTHAAYLNPSLLTKQRNSIFIQFLGVGAYGQNNYLKYNAPFTPSQWSNKSFPSQYTSPNGFPIFNQDWLTEYNLNGSAKNFNFEQDIRAFSFMFPISSRSYLAFNMRQRNGAQILGLDEPFARIARYGINSDKKDIFSGSNPLELNQTYKTTNGFKAHLESWQEYGFSLASNLSNTSDWDVSAGISLKYLRGMGMFHLSSKDLALRLNTSDSMTFTQGEVNYAHSSADNAFNPFTNPENWGMGNTTGHGVGADIGITITKRSKKRYSDNIWGWDQYCLRKNNYSWRIGASVMDLGFISHGKGIKNYTSNFGSPNGFATRNNMFGGFGNPNVDGFETLDQEFESQIGMTKTENFVSYLPTALSLQADVRFSKYFFVSANYQKSLKGTTANGLNATEFYNITPRLEGYFAELAFPITYNKTFSNQTSVGFYTRLWVFYFGSDNIGGLLNMASNSSFSGASIYGGLSLGIPYCWGEKYTESTTEKRVMQDSTKRQEPLIKPDTVTIIQKDTVVIKDTESIQREKELLERQRELEEQIKEMERRTPTNTSTNCVDCERRLRNERLEKERAIRERDAEMTRNNQLQREINLLRDQRRNLEIDLANCRDQLRRLPSGSPEQEACLREIKNKTDEILRCETEKNNLLIKVQQLERDKVELEKKVLVLEIEKSKCDTEKQAEIEKTKNLANRILLIERELKECRNRTSAETPQEEIVRLRNRIVILEKEKEELVLEKETCDAQKRELDIKIKALEIELTKCKSDNSVVEDLKRDNETLRKQLNTLQDSLAKINITIVTLQTQNKKCEEESVKLRATVATLEKDKQTCEDQTRILQDKINELETKLKNCSTNSSKCDEELAEILKLKQQLEFKSDTIAQLQNRLNNATRDMKIWEKNAKDAYNLLEICNTDKIELEAKLKKCEENSQTSTSDEWKEKALKYENDLKLCETNSKVIKDSLTIAKSQLVAAQETKKKCEEELSSLKNKLQNTEKELTDSKADVNALNTKVKDLETKLKNCNSESNPDECETEKAELLATKTKLENARDSLASLTVRFNNVSRDMKIWENNAKDAYNKLEACIASEIELKEKLEKAEQTNCASVATQLNNAKKVADSLSRENKILQNELEQCKDQTFDDKPQTPPQNTSPNTGGNTLPTSNGRIQIPGRTTTTSTTTTTSSSSSSSSSNSTGVGQPKNDSESKVIQLPTTQSRTSTSSQTRTTIPESQNKQTDTPIIQSGGISSGTSNQNNTPRANSSIRIGRPQLPSETKKETTQVSKEQNTTKQAETPQRVSSGSRVRVQAGSGSGSRANTSSSGTVTNGEVKVPEAPKTNATTAEPRTGSESRSGTVIKR